MLVCSHTSFMGMFVILLMECYQQIEFQTTAEKFFGELGKLGKLKTLLFNSAQSNPVEWMNEFYWHHIYVRVRVYENIFTRIFLVFLVSPSVFDIITFLSTPKGRKEGLIR